VTGEGKSVRFVSASCIRGGNSTKAKLPGMRLMLERAYERRGEKYNRILSPKQKASQDCPTGWSNDHI
jgi:hypothetical protein